MATIKKSLQIININVAGRFKIWLTSPLRLWLLLVKDPYYKGFKREKGKKRKIVDKKYNK